METQAVSCHTGKVGLAEIARLSDFFDLQGETRSEFPGWDTDLHPYPHCGTVRYAIRCSEGGEAHHSETRKNHCDSKDCPVCYPTWARRQGKRAAERVFAGFCDDIPRWSGNPSNLYHVTFSAPESWYHLPYREQVRRLVKVAKSAGLRGYGYVHHPARFMDLNTGDEVPWKHCSMNRYAQEPIVDSVPVPGTHIHAVGWGWLRPADEVFDETGVVYKKIRAGQVLSEKEVAYIFTYALTHTAVLENSHAVRYGGVISYNKYQVDYVEVTHELKLCPVCDAYLERYHEATDTWVPYSIQVTRRHFKYKHRVIDSQLKLTPS